MKNKLRVGHLQDLFSEINALHFNGFLDAPILKWNTRLTSSAGRFIPGVRKWLSLYPPTIEIASYLLEEVEADKFIRDTLAHEMIHLWLWVRRKSYGHTPEFYSKMQEMGVSRYNPVPKTRPYKYLYHCVHCLKGYPARRLLAKALACAKCCKEHANGKYDVRFKLELLKQLKSGELV